MATRSSVGVDKPSPVSCARYWMKRAAGLAIAPPAPIGCHADHVASGVRVAPERVWNVMPLPAGTRRTEVSVVQGLEPGPLSRTRDVKVPLGV